MVAVSTTSTRVDDICAASVADSKVPDRRALQMRHSTGSSAASKTSRKSPGDGCDVVGTGPPGTSRS